MVISFVLGYWTHKIYIEKKNKGAKKEVVQQSSQVFVPVSGTASPVPSVASVSPDIIAVISAAIAQFQKDEAALKAQA